MQGKKWEWITMSCIIESNTLHNEKRWDETDTEYSKYQVSCHF